jgi:hypothetical protein
MRAARRRALLALAAGFQLLFCASVFARLGAPLLWQDEAETAMFGRGVLEHGVPKIHIGRNIVYGAHLPLALGRNEALDAYLGSPWGQYFFAATAVAWSDGSSDLAARTWRMRVPFALAGWLGVLLLGRAAATLWPAAAGARSGFWAGFGACLALSVSLQLHLREVRYYPLVVLALGVIAQLEVRRYARGDLPPLRHALLLAPALFGLFNLFYPAFTAVIATALAAHAFHAWRSTATPRARAIDLARGAAPYALACVAALPMVALFGLPAQSRSFFEYFGTEGAGLAHQLAWAGYYLLRFEFTAPVVIGASALAAARWQLRGGSDALRPALAACDLVLGLVAIWVVLIARTPLFFSRYLVALSPVLAAVCVLQIGCLVALRDTRAARTARAGLAAVAVAWLVCAGVRTPELRGRVAELGEPYRGPLDHVIPYLAEHYPRPQELVIATNYEDFPYMFYLGATTVFGYYAPERERDLSFVPDVIIPRPWPVNMRALEHLANQQNYAMQGFPVANVRVNNFPELSPRNQSELVHRFRSPVPGADGAGLVIGERVQP